MSVRDNIRSSCGYVITETGRQALAEADRCFCEIKIRGGIVECPHCGTIYGLVREMFAQLGNGGLGRKGA